MARQVIDMKKADKSWQSRMSEGQDALAVDFVESISYDWRLYEYDIAGSLAHGQMLCEQGLLSEDELAAIRKGLEDIRQEIAAGKFTFDKQYEDIHMVVEAALTAKIGEPAKKLHTGRSRNDQVALDMRLWMRDEIDKLEVEIKGVQGALVGLAEKDGEIVMPGYTHLQRAQPVLAGIYVLAFVEMLERDRERLVDLGRRVNQSPLGAGALSGSSLPLNRRRVADLLKFEGITRNCIDSVSDRDFCAEFAFVCSMAGMHLSRLAEDWIIYTTQEFGFIRTDDAYCTGSSMMPQKRNPDMLELIRGKSGGFYGNLMSLLTMLKGQPLSYNRDMQEDKKYIFASADSLAACLRMAGAIVSHTRFVSENIGRDIEKGFLDATSLAEYLVRKAVPFRQAHQIVGRLVGKCEDVGKQLAELTLAELKEASAAIEEDVYDCLTAANVAGRYAVEGSAGSKQLAEQLKFWREKLYI